MCSSPPRPAPILTALARGEYAVFLSASHADVIAQRKAGAPIKLLRPSEGVGITQINQSLIKNAPHPNAAKLWISGASQRRARTCWRSRATRPCDRHQAG